MSALGRSELVRYLATHPQSTINEIQKATGLVRPAIRSSLADIDSLGFLIRDGSPRGPHVRYSINLETLTKALPHFAVPRRLHKADPVTVHPMGAQND
jgi:DNA-binding IclR family transcriptional regulator